MTTSANIMVEFQGKYIDLVIDKVQVKSYDAIAQMVLEKVNGVGTSQEP